MPHGGGAAPGTFPPEYEKATDWLWNLPKSVEIRKRLAALRTTGAQKQAEERARAYRERIVEKHAVATAGSDPDLQRQTGCLRLGRRRAACRYARRDGVLRHRRREEQAREVHDYQRRGDFVSREQPEQFNADLIQFMSTGRTTPNPNRAVANIHHSL